MKDKVGSAPASRLLGLVGLCVFLAALVPVIVTIDDPGLAWDEATYLAGAANIIAHLDARMAGEESDVEDPWDRQSAHPPFGKFLIGVVMTAFRRLFGQGKRAYLFAGRLTGALAFAGTAWLLYKLGAMGESRWAGLAAAGAWILFPRAFGHAHFAALDMPLAFFFTATTYAFLRCGHRGRGACLAGILWGLALSVKVNAILIPFFLIPVGFILDGKGNIRRSIVFLTVGAVVFCALFVPMWQTGPRQLLQYASGGAIRAIPGEGAIRTGVPVSYFGATFAGDTPWHYYPVMAVLVSPVLFVIFWIVGILTGWKEKEEMRRIVMTAVAGVAVCLAASVLGPFPKYDGVRLVLYIFPMLALLAGVGVWWALSRIRLKGLRGACALVLAMAVGAPVVLFHPFQLSYYSEAIGSIRGAERRGFDVNYWHECHDDTIFGWLNELAPPGAKVAFFPAGAAAQGYWYAPNELLRAQLADGGTAEWPFFLREDLKVEEIGAVDTVEDLRRRGISCVVIANRRSFLAGTALGSDVEQLTPAFYNEVPFAGVRLSSIYRIDAREPKRPF